MSNIEDQPVDVVIPSDNGDNGEIVEKLPLSEFPLIHKTSDYDEPELISLPTESTTDAEISEEASLAEEIAINTSNLDGDEVLDSPGGSCSRASNHASPMRNLSSASGGLYVSAPGKLILFGEHAVVYGRTAIAGSIDLRTYVSLFTSADGRIYLSLPDLGVEKTWLLKDLLKAADRLAVDHPVEEDQAPSLEVLVPIARKLSGSCEDQCGVQHLAILAFWYLLLGVAQRKSYLNRKQKDLVNGEGDASAAKLEQKRDLLAVKATVRFKLPSCVGLGSSGAYCVCIATSLLQTAGLISAPSVVADDDGSLTWDDKDLDMIRKWATAAESLIHGRASGLDAAVCTYGYRDYGYQSFTHLGYVGCHGGVASYNSRTGIEHLKNLPNLRVILVNSKVERNTSRMVQNVKQQMKTLPGVVESIFNGIDEISKEGAKILHKPLEENGDLGEDTPINGGMTASSVGNSDHHSLQPNRTPSIRSQTLSSYVSGGKRGSSASAISAVSDKGEPDTFSRLNDLCRINNHLLNALGVGHPKIDQICTTLSRYGIHPKMTGAGGGGSVFAFLKPDTSQTLLDMIKSELNKLGYEVFQPYLGGAGVVEHQSRPDLFLTPSTASTPAPKHK